MRNRSCDLCIIYLNSTRSLAGQLFGNTNQIEMHLLQRLKIRWYTYVTSSDTWSYVSTSVSWNEDLAGCARLSQRGKPVWKGCCSPPGSDEMGCYPVKRFLSAEEGSCLEHQPYWSAVPLSCYSAGTIFRVNNKATRVWRLDGLIHPRIIIFSSSDLLFPTASFADLKVGSMQWEYSTVCWHVTISNRITISRLMSLRLMRS